MNHTARIEKLRALMGEAGVEAFVAVTIENSNPGVQYLTGFGGTVGAVAVSATSAALAVDARYTERARAESAVAVVPASHARVADFSQYLTGALEALALPAGARVGYEGWRVPDLMARSWQEKFKNLVPVTRLVERLREVKDAEEVQAVRDACALTTMAFADIQPLIVPGATEVALATALDAAIRAHGAVKNSFDTIVASGPHSAIPHHATGERALKAGEAVVIDFGGMYPSGYCSDITRTVFVPGAEPDPELKKIYEIVKESNARAREAARAGMTWREYDAVARDYITEHGYGEQFGHGLGHSIGLEVHDPYDYATRPFEPGVIMSDEPGIYIPGKGGVRIEDDLVITASGAELLNQTP